MTPKRESIDEEANKEREAIVRFYCENEQLLGQAIKDFEHRIALKSAQLESDRDILKRLRNELKSIKRNRE